MKQEKLAKQDDVMRENRDKVKDIMTAFHENTHAEALNKIESNRQAKIKEIEDK